MTLTYQGGALRLYALFDYGLTPETQEDIQNDKYTIQFLLKNEDSFINITN